MVVPTGSLSAVKNQLPFIFLTQKISYVSLFRLPVLLLSVTSFVMSRILWKCNHKKVTFWDMLFSILHNLETRSAFYWFKVFDKWMYHNFLKHSFREVHLMCLQFLDIANKYRISIPGIDFHFSKRFFCAHIRSKQNFWPVCFLK